MTAKTKNEALRKPAPATPFPTRKRTYLKSGARVRVWKFITAMFVALACAALLYWHDLTVGPIFAACMLFFASLTALAAWSASVSIKLERQRVYKKATRIMQVTLFVVLPLIVVGLAWSWVAAGFGASILLVAWLNFLAGGVPVGDNDGSWSGDWFDDDDISNRDGIKSTYTDPSYSYMPENIYYTDD